MKSIRAIFPVIALAALISGSLLAPLLHEFKHASVDEDLYSELESTHDHPDFPSLGEACSGLLEAQPPCVLCSLSNVWDASHSLQSAEVLFTDRSFHLHFAPSPSTASLACRPIRGPPSPFIA